jgi:hypothetical protein
VANLQGGNSVLCEQQRELLRNYLAQVKVLRESVQHHFSAINAGNYEGTSKERYLKQKGEVRQAYKQLIDHRQSHGCGANLSTLMMAGN